MYVTLNDPNGDWISLSNATGEEKKLTITIGNGTGHQTASLRVSFEVAQAIATFMKSLSSE